MTIMQRLAAKQKADAARVAEQAAKHSAARIARKVSRETSQPNGLDDLPLAVSLAIEENPPQPARPEPEPVPHDATPEELVSRLESIKDRIFRLHAIFAVTLSHDIALEANRYVVLFQALAAELKKKQPDAFDQLVVGHEAILLSPPIPIKRTVPIEAQRWVELRWEARQSPIRRSPKRSAEEIPDGLGWML